jgi:hypothetical protein
MPFERSVPDVARLRLKPELIGCPISMSFATCYVCLELRSLPSAGVTRFPRYYDPLRHPRAPGLSPNAHKDLREIWLSPNRAAAEAAMTTFAEKYAPKYDKAIECLIKDRPTLLTFFPADHCDHLRTSNPIESVFATVRHRTVRMKGALSQDTARLMVFKLVMAASKTWRRLRGQNQLPKLIDGVKFKDGIEEAADMKSAA